MKRYGMKVFCNAWKNDTMTWVKFREVFEREFLGVDVLYVKAQEYHNLRKKHMIVKEYSTKLNALAWYTSSMASTDKGKTKIFINRPYVDIAKNCIDWR